MNANGPTHALVPEVPSPKTSQGNDSKRIRTSENDYEIKSMKPLIGNDFRNYIVDRFEKECANSDKHSIDTWQINSMIPKMFYGSSYPSVRVRCKRCQKIGGKACPYGIRFVLFPLEVVVEHIGFIAGVSA